MLGMTHSIRFDSDLETAQPFVDTSPDRVLLRKLRKKSQPMGILSKRLKRLVGNGRASARAINGFDCGLPVFQTDLQPQRVDQPPSGHTICQGLTLYHDAGDGVFSWRQLPDYSLQVTAYQFQGSYMSLALALDSSLMEALQPGRFLRLTSRISTSRPITTFLRLNVQIEGRREQMHETLVLHSGIRVTYFDLDGLPGRFGAVSNAWLDMIFADPQMVEITLHDLKIDDTPPDRDQSARENTYAIE